SPLLVGGAAAGHRGRRPDAEDVVPSEGLAATADEHGDVGTLPPAVGVEFVEHQEPESLSGADECPILCPRKQQLEHHVVRQQDVWWFPANGFASVTLLLPRVSREASG